MIAVLILSVIVMIFCGTLVVHVVDDCFVRLMRTKKLFWLNMSIIGTVIGTLCYFIAFTMIINVLGSGLL